LPDAATECRPRPRVNSRPRNKPKRVARLRAQAVCIFVTDRHSACERTSVKPVMTSETWSNSHFVVTCYATLWACFCILLPLYLASRFRQEYGTSWRYLVIGAALAGVSVVVRRVLLHVPSFEYRIAQMVLALPWRAASEQKTVLRVVVALLRAV